MPEMTAREFAEKLIKEKPFRVEVINHCYDVDPPEGDKYALFKWLNVGAQRMGYEYSDDEFTAETNALFNKLSGFKKLAFVGSIITKTNKAKKAAMK